MITGNGSQDGAKNGNGLGDPGHQAQSQAILREDQGHGRRGQQSG